MADVEKSPHKTPEGESAADEKLREMLGEPYVPTPEEYAQKKADVARKMDKLEFVSRARMQYIKSLAKNNEKKRLMITSFNDKRLEATCQEGLKTAETNMDLMEKEHLKMKSVDRRMKIIQKFCVNIEVQASKNQIKEEDLPPIPNNRMFPDLETRPVSKNFRELLDDTEPAKKRETLCCVSLLQPYQLPKHVTEKLEKDAERRATRLLNQKLRAAKGAVAAKGGA